MKRFFPLVLTFERRREMITFKQGAYESLYNAWERYKKLLKRCPMHGIDQITQMDIFYHAMNCSSKGVIDETCCGAFKRKNAEKANQLIQDLEKCNYRTPSEASGSNERYRVGGVPKLNKMAVIEAELDVIVNRLNSQERRSHNVKEVGLMQGEEANQEVAQEGDYHLEECNYLNEGRSYHFTPNPNLPNHYTSALRYHENLSYGKGAHQS